MAEFEVEQVDEEEFAALDAALRQAEQAYAAAHTRAPLCNAQPGSGGLSSTCVRVPIRKLPRSLAAAAAPQQASSGEAAATCGAGGKRKIPSSLTAPSAAAAQLPYLSYQGPCQYVFTGVEVDGLCELLLKSNVSYCGFDIEWHVTYQAGVAPRPVAVVQLCFPEPPGYRCLLLHVARSGLTPHLKQLLCSQDMLKVGVGAHGDALKIQRDFGFEMGGVLDLSEFANCRLYSEGVPLQKWSLAGLTERLMQRTLEKAQSLRCSDWEQCPLSTEQRNYAAADVFASLRVYEILHSMPVVWQPNTVLPSAQQPANPGGADGNHGCELIPACPDVAQLQPAKLQVYQQHMAGQSLQQIAIARHIQEDSAMGYLAEAITAGYAYSWQRAGVPDHALRSVAGVAGRLLNRSLACELPLRHSGGETPAAVACAGGSNTAQASGGGQGSGVVAGYGQQQGGGTPACHTAPGQTSTSQAPHSGAGSSGGRPVDVLHELLGTGVKIRELKEQHWFELPYGWIRLALAHLGRCNTGPWGMSESGKA